MKLVTLDFETYYDKDYSLSKLSTTEYLTHPRFRALNFALKVDGKPAVNIDTPYETLKDPQVKALLNACCLVAHHAQFDAAILAWHFGIYPKFSICTMAMARPLGHLQTGVSLAALGEFYNLGTKAPLSPESTPEERALRAIQDVELTHKLAKLLIEKLPSQELALIDWTIRIYTRPVLRLDVPRTEKLITTLAKQKQDALDDLGVDRETLASTPQFATLLESLDVDVPTKLSPATRQPIPALAKTDPGMQELLEHEDVRVQALCAARLGIKSTGDETRARRLLQAQQRLPALPVYLNYCLSGGSLITVLRAGNKVLDIRLDTLHDDDLVWDGQEFVAHEGLIDQGFRETIEYQGVVATSDHRVYLEDGTETTISAAKRTGQRLMGAALPGQENRTVDR